MALLSFIVLGLMAVFNQTQRAFMTGLGQTDVLEGGRTVMDMMTRELEQLTPAGTVTCTNFYCRVNDNDGTLAPLIQFLPGTAGNSTITRTNYLQDIYILTRQNQNWVGIGYCVRLADPTGLLYPAMVDPSHAGSGSLYRWSATMPVLVPSDLSNPPFGHTYRFPGVPTDPGWLFEGFINACAAANKAGALSRAITNRICDGVVSLRLRAFATNGFPIFVLNSVNGGATPLFWTETKALNYFTFKNAQAQFIPSYPDNMGQLYCWSNAVPAYLELELGIMEPRTYSKYDSIPVPAARLAYIQRDDTSTRVHLFRQRIPVRDVDPAAFQ